MLKHNYCKYSCVGCTKTEPDGPIEKMMYGVLYYSVKPSCHHNASQGAFERGFPSSERRNTTIPRTQLA